MNWMEGFSRWRIAISRVAALALFALLLFTRKPLWQGSVLVPVMQGLGFLLLMASMLGRLWSLQFLSGYKTRTVVREGPYSVVRNPLYLFSFLGALGAGLVANHAWLLGVLSAAFLFYYPFVVRNEENWLRRELGEEFEQYCRAVPRFLPRWSLYHSPERYEVRSRSYAQAFRDAIWFPLAFLLLTLLVRLQECGVLPLQAGR